MCRTASRRGRTAGAGAAALLLLNDLLRDIAVDQNVCDRTSCSVAAVLSIRKLEVCGQLAVVILAAILSLYSADCYQTADHGNSEGKEELQKSDGVISADLTGHRIIIVLVRIDPLLVKNLHAIEEGSGCSVVIPIRKILKSII